METGLSVRPFLSSYIVTLSSCQFESCISTVTMETVLCPMSVYTGRFVCCWPWYVSCECLMCECAREELSNGINVCLVLSIHFLRTSFPFHQSSIEQKPQGQTRGVGQVCVRRKGTESVHLVTRGTMAAVQIAFRFSFIVQG